MNERTEKTKKNRGGSMSRKIMAPFLAVMFFQALLVYGMFYLLNVTDELKEGAADLLAEKTLSRSEQFEIDMSTRWGDVRDEAGMVTGRLKDLLASGDRSLDDFNGDPVLQERFLTQVAAEIVYILHKNDVIRVFLALDGDPSSRGDRLGLCFRDVAPAYVADDYSDVVITRAPGSIAGRMELAPDEGWAPVFAASECGLWYRTPFDAAKANPGLPAADLGYWSADFSRADDAREVCFSVPLIYEGRPYGVMGVTLNPDFMKAILLGAASFTTETGYALAVGEPYAPPDAAGVEPPSRFSVAVSDGLFANAAISGGNDILLVPDGEFDQLYRVGGLDDEAAPLRAVVRRTRVYGPASPFGDQEWAVIGVRSERSLFGFARRVNALMLVVFVAFLVIGFIGATIVARVVAAPMRVLTRQLRGKDPNAEIKLNRIGVDEVDELSEAIERLSVKVADANRKLADLLELSETSLAVFEYHGRNNNRVIYTRRFAERFGLLRTGENSMGLRDFMRYMRGLNPVREPDLELGDYDRECVVRVNYGGHVSWLRVVNAKENARRAGVITDITREAADRRRLEYERDYDMLTDVYNRRAFHAKMAACFNAPDSMGVAALIMLDLDNLKTLNDTYGHDYGDRYIRLTADVLKKFSSERVVVARLAGDEFVVFFHGFDDKSRIRSICDRIKSDMNGAFLDLPDGSGTAIQISAGVAWYPDDSESSEELIRFADFAMYTVKKTKKGQFKEFDFGVYNKHAYMLHKKSDFDDIIENEKLHYGFQPIVDAVTGDIFAYEALLRPEGENIQNPSEIISLAKAHSRLEQIECITLNKAMEAFIALDAAKKTDRRVFINTIADQKMPYEAEQLFEERFREFLPRVVCEVAGSGFAGDAVMEYKIERMKALGVELAFDDFGTGRNGENAALEYAPRYLKIDETLIKNIHLDAERQATAEDIIRRGKRSGVLTLAEGVELREEMEYLIGAGIDLMQGYYLCRPMVDPPLELPEIKSEIAAMRARL